MLKPQGFVVLMIVLWACGAWAGDQGVCRRVIDGDTLEVEGVGRVRVIGVDTPELARDGKKAEKGAEKARAFTRDAALGKRLRLDYDAERRDKFGRTLAYVTLPDGADLGEALLRRCLAEPIYYLPYARKDAYLRLYRDSCR